MSVDNITESLDDMQSCVSTECDDDEFLPLKLPKRKKKVRTYPQPNEHIPEETKDDDLKKGELYSYNFLLNRLYDKLRSDNPKLTGTPSKAKLQPLDVQKDGTRKTLVANFENLCTELNRDMNHVMQYIVTELCVKGSIDGSKRLVLRGRFSPGALGTIARKYVNEYVICYACKTVDTIIEKDKQSRLNILRCNTCGASRCVQHIVQGFRAKV